MRPQPPNVGIAGLAKKAGAALRASIVTSLRQGLHSWRESIWLFLALAIGVWVRVDFLSQPMRNDEAFTFLNFANGGLRDLFNYSVPNNHVLHTILVKISTLMWGTDPAAIRLPAFLAGIAAIPLIYMLSRGLNEKSGVFASLAASVFPFLILYSTNARGYSLVLLLTLVLAWVGNRYVKNPSPAGAVTISLVAALGMLTMPSMLFAIAGVYFWLFCLFLIARKSSFGAVLRDFVLPCGSMTIILTIVLYTPVIAVSNGWKSIIANPDVRPQSWHEFASQLFPHIQLTVSHFSRDIPGILLVLGILLMAVGLYSSARRRDWATLLLLPSVLVGSAILFLAQHRIPFDRTWIYMIPFALLLADAGFTFVVGQLPRLFQSFVWVASVLAAAFLAAQLVSSNAIAKYPDTGGFTEAPIVARYLASVMTDNDEIVARTPADWPTYYYLWADGVRNYEGHASSGTGAIYYIVEKSRYTLHSMTAGPVIMLLDLDDAAVYRGAAGNP